MFSRVPRGPRAQPHDAGGAPARAAGAAARSDDDQPDDGRLRVSGVDLEAGLAARRCATNRSRFGLTEARAAVACDYARRGIDVAPERIVLTASTSEAYSLLFKLLCDPGGDAVMVPVPSYPLFDHLTRLDGVQSDPYRLDYHGRWTIAIDDARRSWTPDVRAVLAVSPNNPTGSVLSAGEHEALATLCADRSAALIIDEVFADYPLTSADQAKARGCQHSQSSRGLSPFGSAACRSRRACRR